MVLDRAATTLAGVTIPCKDSCTKCRYPIALTLLVILTLWQWPSFLDVLLSLCIKTTHLNCDVCDRYHLTDPFDLLNMDIFFMFQGWRQPFILPIPASVIKTRRIDELAVWHLMLLHHSQTYQLYEYELKQVCSFCFYIILKPQTSNFKNEILIISMKQIVIYTIQYESFSSSHQTKISCPLIIYFQEPPFIES